jgi:hypothetical protein
VKIIKNSENFETMESQKLFFFLKNSTVFDCETCPTICFRYVISDRLILTDPDARESNIGSWKELLLEKISDLQNQFVWVTKKHTIKNKSKTDKTRNKTKFPHQAQESLQESAKPKRKVSNRVSFTNDTKRGSVAAGDIQFSSDSENDLRSKHQNAQKSQKAQKPQKSAVPNYLPQNRRLVIPIPYSKNLGFAVMDTVNGITVAQVSTTSKLYKKVQIGDVLLGVNGRSDVQRAHEVKGVLARNGSEQCRFVFVGGSEEQRRLARSIISDKHVLGMKIKSSEFLYM